MARKGWEGPDDAPGWDLVGGDPAPGDAATIRTYATRYRDIADNTEHAGTIATMLKGDHYGKGGAGKTMEQVSARIAELPGWLGKLTTAFRAAGEAVDKYTGVLEQAQGDAQRALTMALEAEAEMKTAGGALGHARAALSFAAEVARDDKKDLATDRDYLAAKDAFEAAKRTVQGVEGKMDMARQIAADARALREGAVKTAVTALNSAAEVRVPDRGLGEKIVDWIKNNSWFKWVIGILSFGLAFFGAIGLAISLTLTAIDMGTVILEGVITGHWDIAALVLGALAFVPGFVWVKAGKTIAGLPGIKQFLALPKVAAFNAAAAAKIGTLVTKVTNFAKTLGNLALTGVKNLGSAIKGLITKGLDNVFQMKTVKVDVRPVSPVHTSPSGTPSTTPHVNSEPPRSPDLDEDIVWRRPGEDPDPIVWQRPATPEPVAPPSPRVVNPDPFATRPVDLGGGVTAFDFVASPVVGRTFKTAEEYAAIGKWRWAFDPGGVGSVNPITGQYTHLKDAPWAKSQVYVADLHGTAHTVHLPISFGRGGAVLDMQVGPEFFASVLKRDPEFIRIKENGGSLVLDSCNTGELIDGFAAKLAQELRIKVYAPDNLSSKGGAGPANVVGHGPDGTIPGEWRVFDPDQIATFTAKDFGGDFGDLVKWELGSRGAGDYLDKAIKFDIPIDDAIKYKAAFDHVGGGMPVDEVFADVQRIMDAKPGMSIEDAIVRFQDLERYKGTGNMTESVRELNVIADKYYGGDFDAALGTGDLWRVARDRGIPTDTVWASRDEVGRLMATYGDLGPIADDLGVILRPGEGLTFAEALEKFSDIRTLSEGRTVAVTMQEIENYANIYTGGDYIEAIDDMIEAYQIARGLAS